MILTQKEILLLLERLKWDPVYEDRDVVVAKKERTGYSDKPEIARIQGGLSIMLEAAARAGR